jgi:D-3-phosphoglycerate dehydrogenase
MAQPKLLLIDILDESLADCLRPLGAEVQLVTLSGPDANAWQAHLADADAIALRSHPMLSADVLARAPRLRLIVRGGSGLDHIDLDYCAQHNIQVVATPEGNADAVGEQAVGMLLGLLNHIPRADRQLRRLDWQRNQNRGHELSGRTVGIIGYGHTGSAFARRLWGFGCRVMAYDKYKTGFGDNRVVEVPMERIWTQADVVSLHVPLTPETRHLANAAWFAQFQQPIWFLNLARGAVTDTAALIDALQSGQVRGAGLDVFENEDWQNLSPLERQQIETLATLDQVVMTPHVGGVTVESARNIEAQVLAHLRRFVNQAAGPATVGC